ncbi:FliH/SctL family protein [Candidatus Villigracilis saccharophilus]|uniref:FliH/SctL family protein n=1 Tax=Candidatus Villigracilis saccharophilus TaxID=3140684 RepID=UPI00313497B3|nr:hypothetical protein [Anaerolineales bacterium]
MKSFNRSRLNSSNEKPLAWDPPEFSTDLVTPANEVQKEKVIALFQNEEESSAGNKGKGVRSALQPVGMDQKFTVWEPGITQWQSEPEVARSAVWNIMDFEESVSDDSDEVEEIQEVQVSQQIPEVLSEENSQPRLSNTEHEVSAILERARLQAEEILLSAQAEADNVILQAQSEIEDQKKQGYEQGLKDARLEMDDAIKAVRALVTEVDQWKNTLMSQSEPILVAMLKELSRKLFGDGMELDPHALQANLNRIMDSAHGLGGLNIFLNPKDARMLDSAWVDQQLLISGGQAKIIPSANITRGGCYVKGNMGTVDGRVETQLEALLKAFDEASILAE